MAHGDTVTRKNGRLTAQERAERATKVVQMRRARIPYDKIGATFDPPLSGTRVCQIYKEALVSHPLTQIQVDYHRLEETELIDSATQHLLAIAVSKENDRFGRVLVSPRTKVEAWAAIRAWSEYKAKLLGLLAPTQVQVTTLDALDAQIIELEAELGMKPGDTGI